MRMRGRVWVLGGGGGRMRITVSVCEHARPRVRACTRVVVCMGWFGSLGMWVLARMVRVGGAPPPRASRQRWRRNAPGEEAKGGGDDGGEGLSLIHISEPTRRTPI
eukprot:3134892-Pleurochrysis_carterae.AAC.1